MSSTDWLYDFLMQTFRSPSWEVPIMNWIDENCIIFDNEEENKLEYTTKHNEFCSLIEQLLEFHLTEIGLSSEDFATVCVQAGTNSVLQGAIFEQILAVDDFLTFKKLMTKRNAELELEVLKELAKSTFRRSSSSPSVVPSVLPSSSSSSSTTSASTASTTVSNQHPPTTKISPSSSEDSTATTDSSTTTDDNNFEEAMAESMLDVEYAKRQTELEIAQLEAAIAASLAIEDERLRLLKEQQQQDKQDEEAAIALSLQGTATTNSYNAHPTPSTFVGTSMINSDSQRSMNQNKDSSFSPNLSTNSTNLLVLSPVNANNTSPIKNNTIPVASSSSLSSSSSSTSISSLRLTTSLQDLPDLPGRNTVSSSSILNTVLNISSVSSSSSSSLSSLPPLQVGNRNTTSTLPSLTSTNNLSKSSVSATYSDELDAALLGNYSSYSSNNRNDNTNGDNFIDSSLLPLGVRRAENYLEESKARLQSLKQKAAKRDDEVSSAELASRQIHLREVRDALRAKNRADREKALAEAETLSSTNSSSSSNRSESRLNVRNKVGEAMNSIRNSFDTSNDGNNTGEEELSEEDKRKLMRLALAQKIKTDVIAATSSSTQQKSSTK